VANEALFGKPVSLFEGLGPHALSDVRALGRPKAAAAGIVFFREGEPATAFYPVTAEAVTVASALEWPGTAIMPHD
jgi:hypothetical protein